HRKTLNALQESSVTRESMTRLAHHAEAIHDPDAVLEFAPLAAWWASTTSSHREAVALYELALRFAKSLPPANHAQMLEAYMVELEFMNRFSDEIEACRSAIALWHSIGNRLREGKNLATLAGLCMNVGWRSEAEKSIERAITILEDLSPSAELAQAYTEQCYIRMMYRDCEAALPWGEKAIKLAERFEDFDALARAYDYMGCAALIIDYDRGLKLLERSLVIAREKKLPFAVGGTLGNLGGMLLEVREVTLANQYLAESINYARQQDNDYHLMESQAWQALANMYQGKWIEADTVARKILEHSSNLPNVTRASVLFTLGRIRIRQGGNNVDQLLDEAFSVSIQADAPRFDSPRLLQAEFYWLIGNQPRVLEETHTAYELALRNKHPWIAGELAFWRWRSGDKNSPPAWIAKPFALQIAGDWHAAAKEWEERGCPYEQAMALVDGDDAAQLAALDIFERLGALPALDILKRKMRADGTRIPRRPRPATRENPFNLTAREMEALVCLVDGLSNHAIAKKLSLSTRTAEHHIASILQKMGVGSRSEAVALALKENLLRTE
ncbi:MAG TPA: LuxR C-terminal-related transcriptional regulator, partial [Anaerolineales bacterium]|nr:LuxR C-terminal-related transcriptional regulator [Anaerolineales bacterium]